MKIKDIAKELVYAANTYCSRGTLDPYTWSKKFEECEDFPKAPETIFFEMDLRPLTFNGYTSQSVVYPRRMNGKKWKITATEVIE